MLRFARMVSLVACAALLAAGDAIATQGPAYLPGVVAAPLMQTDEPTLAPIAFVRFCMNNAHACVTDGRSDDVVTLTPEMRRQVEAVNTGVNGRIRPRVKRGEVIETWALNPESGDCNDYAVTKRQELIDRGLPSRALLLASAITGWGEPHLILILRSDRGDLILDNLVPAIRSWNSTGYRWLARQSAADPRRWERIAPAPQQPAVQLAARTKPARVAKPTQPAVAMPRPVTPSEGTIAFARALSRLAGDAALTLTLTLALPSPNVSSAALRPMAMTDGQTRLAPFRLPAASAASLERSFVFMRASLSLRPLFPA